MKTLYLFAPNDLRIKNNAIFDTRIDPNWSIYVQVKNYLQKNNIEMKTIDLGTPKKDDAILCLDTPYPWNSSAWSMIRNTDAKTILLAQEPPIVNPFNHIKLFTNKFDRVLTWNDNVVDNKQYFKYNWPQSNKDLDFKQIPFRYKKFLTLINGNKLPFFLFKPLARIGKELYSARIESIEYFEKHIPKEFDLYGVGWNEPKKYNISERIFGYKKYNVYKGRIDNKIAVLGTYKFCICFENLTDVDGYFTEKIFDAFKARCVPIYWGASNVESYISKDCFIDFRQFRGYPELIAHLNKMSEKTYNTYIENIEKLLKDNNFLEDWFEQGFAKQIYRIVK